MTGAVYVDDAANTVEPATSGPVTNAPRYGRVVSRLVLISLGIAAEAAFLVYNVHPRSHQYNQAYAVLGAALQPVMYFVIALGLLLSSHLGPLRRTLVHHSAHHPWWRMLPFQLVSYVTVLLAAGLLMPTEYADFRPAQPELIGGVWLVMLAVSIIATVGSSLLLLAPARYWYSFMQSEIMTVALAGAFATGAYLIGLLSQQSWQALSGPTLRGASAILGLWYPHVITDFDAALLGTPNFYVVIDAACSGYEGIGLITAFLTWYLYSFRGHLKMPHALLLFPIGGAVMWSINCVRVAILVTIGSSWSPEVALQGFHSNAGWIGFIAAAIGIVWIARTIPFFAATASGPVWQIDASKAAVMPFLVLLAATLITSAFSTEFPWLYPVRVIAASCAIGLLWRQLRLAPITVDALAVLAGLAVFAMWLMLVPDSPARDRWFAATLYGASSTTVAFWLQMRVLGAVIVVPICEELAFRQYMPQLLRARASVGAGRVQLAPLALSSLLFGALHGAWLAGTLTGVVYYLIKVRRGRIGDAVLAHATTNLCLSVYVLFFAKWSYW